MANKYKYLIAHIKKLPDGSFDRPHFLEEHLERTAKLTAENCADFINYKVPLILGYLHDIGKASDAFQERIRIKSGFEAEEAHLEGKSAQHVDHSTAGAQLSAQKYDLLGILPAYIIAGHHTGLPNGKSSEESSLYSRLHKEVEAYNNILPWLNSKLPDINPKDFMPKNHHYNSTLTPYQFQFLIRMLFSALTDADFIDTEEYMNPDKTKQRGSMATMEELKKSLDDYFQIFLNKKETFVNRKRNEILKTCILAANEKPGIFSLTVPTGGGKTLSSMAFAVNHAIKHNLKRIIYVIPYTTIISQNAQIFRDLFSNLGEDVVIEHHSNMEPAVETAYNRLATENWDAPVIVTTNVQFFESFYSNKNSVCRKLHNISRSIIVFDEAQMFPPEYLKPVLRVLNELNKNYGCSIVLCTATQPALNKSKILADGLDNVKEIIEKPEELYKQLKRVHIKILPGTTSDDQLIRHMEAYEQALCIVNTRKHARELYRALSDMHPDNSCFHLSTMMCPQHRVDELEKIKHELSKHKPCRVISTQLIEAGVDIDFPVVYRAMAGLDSIAQAAGRCNREGLLTSGNVFVFQPKQKAPPGHLRKCAESGAFTLKKYRTDPLTPPAIEKYFQDLFGKSDLDEHGILQLCNSQLDEIPFKEISEKFRFIRQTGFSLIIPYGHGKELINSLRACYEGRVPMELRRQLQRYTINIFRETFMAMAPVIEDVFRDGQFYVLLNDDIYDEKIGLNPDIPEFIKTESLII
ncbi:MAG: CRISPR-associated helicase Cas3' [Calditrichaeota bacterium]|nr:MAG: CRISPR-associated helicase Cas3' [Calditrichota bacterium]